MLYFDRIDVSKEIDVNKTSTSKELYFSLLVFLKACVRYFLSNFYFLSNDSLSKTMKNVFYFI